MRYSLQNVSFPKYFQDFSTLGRSFITFSTSHISSRTNFFSLNYYRFAHRDINAANFLTFCTAVSGVTKASKVAGSFLITLSKHPIEFDPTLYRGMFKPLCDDRLIPWERG